MSVKMLPPSPSSFQHVTAEPAPSFVAQGAPRASPLLELPKAFKNIEKLTPNSTYRDGSVIKIDNFFKEIFFCIRELFYGGKAKNDHRASQNFYVSTIQLISDLKIS